MIFMKRQATILTIASLLSFSQQAKAQPSEQAKTTVAGIQDLCWSPEGGYIYFSGLWHKPDYSDYHPGKWNIYRYDFKTKTAVMFADSAFTVAVDGTGNKIAIGKLVNGNRVFMCWMAAGKIPKESSIKNKRKFSQRRL